jgi:hypothetical protein
MRFKFKLENHRKIFVEKPFIVSKRITILKKYLKYKENPNVTFIFLDKTWIYRKTWVNDNMPSNCFKIQTSEGQRFTVLHAG